MKIENIYPLIFKAMDRGNVGAWYWNIKSGHQEWSELTMKLLALPAGRSATLEHFYSVLHPDDRGKVSALIKNAIRLKSDNYQAEYRVVYPDGSMRWLSAPGCVFMDGNGRSSSMAGILVDITHKKLINEQLNKTNEIYRNIFESSLIGIVLFDMRGAVDIVNSAFQDMLGYAEYELKNMRFEDLIHPDDVDIHLTKIKGILSGELARFSLGERFFHKDGHVVDVQSIISKSPQHSDEQGQIIMLVRDISKEKITEEKLIESEYLRELALSSAELGAWDCDLISGNARYDERYCSMLGYELNELEPNINSWLNMIHPEDMSRVKESMQAHLARETRIYHSEHRLRHKHGHWIWILSRGKALFDDQGNPTRATGTMCDITDRKHEADQVVKMMQKIESLISQIGGDEVNNENDNLNGSEGSLHLSRRACQIINMVAKGKNSGEIAQILSISKSTVETHRRNLMRKLGLNNTAELVRFAIKNGLSE